MTSWHPAFAPLGNETGNLTEFCPNPKSVVIAGRHCRLRQRYLRRPLEVRLESALADTEECGAAWRFPFSSWPFAIASDRSPSARFQSRPGLLSRLQVLQPAPIERYGPPAGLDDFLKTETWFLTSASDTPTPPVADTRRGPKDEHRAYEGPLEGSAAAATCTEEKDEHVPVPRRSLCPLSTVQCSTNAHSTRCWSQRGEFSSPILLIRK